MLITLIQSQTSQSQFGLSRNWYMVNGESRPLRNCLSAVLCVCAISESHKVINYRLRTHNCRCHRIAHPTSRQKPPTHTHIYICIYIYKVDFSDDRLRYTRPVHRRWLFYAYTQSLGKKLLDFVVVFVGK